VTILDKFMLFIEQHSEDAFNKMLLRKYGANLETNSADAVLQRSIEQFYNVHE